MWIKIKAQRITSQHVTYRPTIRPKAQNICGWIPLRFHEPIMQLLRVFHGQVSREVVEGHILVSNARKVVYLIQ